MILKQEVKVKWHGGTRKHYESLGYQYTKKDKEFIVCAEHLSRSSNMRVMFSCDYCGEVGDKRFDTIMSQRSVIGKDCCVKCAPLKHNESKLLSGSLLSNYPKIAGQWCIKENEKSALEITPYSGVMGTWLCEEGHTWKAPVYSRTSGTMTGCPECSSSKGEKMVAEVLDSYDAIYEKEYSFKDLRGIGGGLLRFDFAIKDCEGLVNKIIEFDGLYHSMKLFEGDGHETLVIHDNMKDEYCVSRGIPILRIPYTNIDRVWTIVPRFLKEEASEWHS